MKNSSFNIKEQFVDYHYLLRTTKLLYWYSIILLILLFAGLIFDLKFLKINNMVVSYLFFMVLLPFINGLLDYISLGISRILGRKILKIISEKRIKVRLWSILFHLGIDIVAAIGLLGSLVFILTAGIEVFNIYVVKDKQIMINLTQLIRVLQRSQLSLIKTGGYPIMSF